MNRRLVTTLGLLVGLLVVPASAAPTAPAVTGATTLVNVASDGTQANGEDSGGPVISADGRYAAFNSRAPNLVAGDTENNDVFVRDRVTGVTTQVSIATDGTQGNGGSHSKPAISADGRFVAFDTSSSNLVPGDTAATDVFVRDRVAGVTTRVSLASGGTQANGESLDPAISADGRFVAFNSPATNLVAGDTNARDDVFVHDRVTGLTTRVSLASGGTQANNGSLDPAISADGRYISFTSRATNLVAGDANARDDVFVHDRVTGLTTRVSLASAGTQANSSSNGGAISADGRYVAFNSQATNLVAGDSNKAGDVFVRDRVAGVTTRVSLASGDTQANGGGGPATISADGRHVAFDSFASNLVPGDSNAATDVFVRDRVSGVTTRVNVASDGTQASVAGVGDENAFPITTAGQVASISGDGRYVGFASLANNLVAGDASSLMDAFVRDRGSVVPVPATPFGDFSGGGWSDLIARQTSSGSLYLYPGNGARFTARVRIGVSGWNSMSAITRFGDFNWDGHEDVVARQRATGALWLYRGKGSGFASRLKIGRSGWNGMREITPVGDLDRDGFPDLLAVKTSTGALYFYPGRRGGLLGARRLIGVSGWNAMGELTGVGDFNRDRHVDLIARHSATGVLWLYPGRTGGFGARTRVGTGWNGMRDMVGVGDFDRNGFTDLIAVQSATGKLFRYPGRGRSFGPRLLVGSGWTARYRPLL